MSSSYYNDSKWDVNHQDSYSYGTSNSLSNPFSRDSYKNAKDESGRTPDQYKESIQQKEIWEKKFKNEKPFQILEKSKFCFHTNRIGRHPPIICDEIIIQNENTNYSIEDIKQFSSGDEKLRKNYEKFIEFLGIIKERIENDFSFRYKLKLTLEFYMYSIEKDKVKMECIYIADIPNENPFEYKDDDILEKGIGAGYSYLLNEINNEAHNDLIYED